MPIDLADSVLVLLAGGKSSRFGRLKGLERVQGLTLIEWQAQRFREAGGDQVVVVLGHFADEYRDALAAAALTIVVNPEPERGSFTSLQAGLAVAHPGSEGAIFILPVDVPAPGPQIWRVLAKPDRSRYEVVVPEVDGRGGHPVRISRSFAEVLREVPWQDADARLDRQMRKVSLSRYTRVVVEDASIRLNLNTQADFAAWESSLDNALPAHNS